MTEVERKIDLVKRMIDQWTPPAPLWVKVVVRLLSHFPDYRISQFLMTRLRNRSMKEFLFVLYKNDCLLHYLQFIKEIEEAQQNATP